MPSLEQAYAAQSLMAFDFGSQKMGIAVGQRLIESATPLPIFSMNDGIPDWDKLLLIIKQWQPDLCIVGLPLNMDDSESELALRARKFARRLHHHSQINVIMVDERLTTREARQTLQQYQASGQAKRITADSMAACLLLESWYHEPIAILP